MPLVASDGITYYTFGSIPLEAAGSDIRQLNTAVEIKAVGGAAIVLRSPATGAVIPSTLTSSAANGLLPSFLAPALQVVVFGGVVDQVLESTDLPELLADVAASRAATEAALAQVETFTNATGYETTSGSASKADAALVAAVAYTDTTLLGFARAAGVPLIVSLAAGQDPDPADPLGTIYFSEG